jgi:hypothetical protein
LDVARVIYLILLHCAEWVKEKREAPEKVEPQVTISVPVFTMFDSSQPVFSTSH